MVQIGKRTSSFSRKEELLYRGGEIRDLTEEERGEKKNLLRRQVITPSREGEKTPRSFFISVPKGRYLYYTLWPKKKKKVSWGLLEKG